MPQAHWCQSGFLTVLPQPWQYWESLVVRVETSCRVPPGRSPGASEMVDEHPWGAKSHASAIANLSAFEHLCRAFSDGPFRRSARDWRPAFAAPSCEAFGG